LYLAVNYLDYSPLWGGRRTAQWVDYYSSRCVQAFGPCTAFSSPIDTKRGIVGQYFFGQLASGLGK
jgi:hypothetical protein